MKKILVSNFKHYHKDNGVKIANAFDNSNGIIDDIKKSLNKTNTIVFIPSDPENEDMVELYSSLLFEGLKLSGIIFDNYLILDMNNISNAEEYIKKADMIFLSGGSPYSQCEYFKSFNLKELISSFEGLVVGQSAGAINMANDAYNSPTDMEESEPIYLEGLGIVDFNLEPHFVYDSSNFDEAELYQRDSILKESYKRVIYGQCDGSHVYVDDNDYVTICGETYLIKNGEITLVCNDGEQVNL